MASSFSGVIAFRDEHGQACRTNVRQLPNMLQEKLIKIDCAT